MLSHDLVSSLVWPVGFLVAAACYLLLNLVWPVRRVNERAESTSIASKKDPEK
jgi:hypothetical protein